MLLQLSVYGNGYGSSGIYRCYVRRVQYLEEFHEEVQPPWRSGHWNRKVSRSVIPIAFMLFGFDELGSDYVALTVRPGKSISSMPKFYTSRGGIPYP